MFKQIILFAFTSVTLFSCTKKDIRTFVMENRNDIRTISPDSTDFSDLEVIGKSIGDSRIVLLGEQDHGDGSAFLAKTRLVKYLHEKKRFNVLAFESDFFALNEGWGGLEKNKTKINSFLRENIFSIWSRCKECDQLLYEYVPITFTDRTPLTISGFDNQIHGAYSARKLKTFLNDYLKRKMINYTKTQEYKIDFLSFIDSIKYNKNLIKQKKFREALRQIGNELSPIDTTRFESMLLKSLTALTDSEIYFLSNNDNYMDVRDKQMADNLKWLLKYKFPNEKIIVWAHNAHILKHPELIKTKTVLKKNMGSHLAVDKELSKQCYFLGFNSRTGTTKRIMTDDYITVGPPAENGFESWIPESVSYAFVDFKEFRIQNPSLRKDFLMKGVNHLSDSAVWTDIYDGIFYIRDMYPCGVSEVDQPLSIEKAK